MDDKGKNRTLLFWVMENPDKAAARLAELWAALAEARMQLEYLGEKFGPTGTGNAVMARINHVLGTKPD